MCVFSLVLSTAYIWCVKHVISLVLGNDLLGIMLQSYISFCFTYMRPQNWLVSRFLRENLLSYFLRIEINIISFKNCQCKWITAEITIKEFIRKLPNKIWIWYPYYDIISLICTGREREIFVLFQIKRIIMTRNIVKTLFSHCELNAKCKNFVYSLFAALFSVFTHALPWYMGLQ